LYRFLLTGALAFALNAAAFGVAGATETVAVTGSDTSAVLSIATQTAPEGGPVSAAALAAAKPHLAALESAAPTAGADLARWGANAPHEERAVAGEPSAVRRFASGIIARSTHLAMSLTRNAMRFIGTPYAFGGTSAGGFDCSGYVQHVFAMLGMRLPRTADAQWAAGRHIRDGVKTGDLVFFQTYERGPSHVGIYLGNDRFIHSSSSRGVVVSSLQDGYWHARYLGAKRVSAN
jgi:cell wall-associated NlpC family hydrolase